MKIKNNKLYFGKISAEGITKKYGTPLYIYEADIIRKRYSDLRDNIPYKKLKIHYACKANANPYILKLLYKLGANIETVSPGKIKLAFAVGFKPSQIIYTCNGVTEAELKFLIKNKIAVNLDSLSQIEKWGKLNPKSKISLRLNQDIGAGSHRYLVTGGGDSKFGIHISHLKDAKRIAKKYKLQIVGIQQHIGTDAFLTPDIFIIGAKALMNTAHQFDDLEFLDFGGGFGIPYRPGEKALDMKKLGKEFTRAMNDFNQSYGKELAAILEPGRYLVAESGTLLAKVTDIKANAARTFVAIDTGMNHLIRPALYNAYHEIVNAQRVNGPKQTVSVVGNICESSDSFGKDRSITRFKEGDVVAILNTGAYGYSMSSHYNSRPRPAEIVVDKEKVILARKREDSSPI